MKKFAYAFLLLGAFTLHSCGSDDDAPPPVAEVDEENPTAPANLELILSDETAITLSWDAATDNVGVTSYTLFQDGVQAQENIIGTTTVISGLTPETTYSFYVIALDDAGNQSDPSANINASTAITFKNSLSQMGVFSVISEDLIPATGVQLYELNTTLFTDYAQKQRLIRLPEGTTLTPNGNDLLPNFPDNTLIAKTFFYNIDDRDPSLGRQIIETRIFLKIAGQWQAADYIWNENQTEATYTTNGSTTPISYIDENGDTQNVDYQIPSQQDCFTCHNNDNSTLPIGLKLRSLNFVPSYANQNQLDFLVSQGILEGVNSGSVSVLPDWTDTATYSLDERARAYLDVNCAHCHQPGGSAPNGFDIDFRLETPFEDTGIYPNRGEIEVRFQSTLPTYRMPQLGRTVVHEEALDMLIEYIDAL
ncbi:fibronectin type III domain-containing protein [Marinirhabdus gelatinilytica]|uniref:Putative repeat protein (TIGR03806 family) n=1 Tax=Marinirhabdus gelatinilytica TaxID=1703343 RepID=A0A370Q7L6_9FLAO|nr:fibronectin type III domain-containing protein [Marinirhabdus gelatinilytica]RDK84333.1 putative repeat protein (TIGR03806 family) [Marinirhabdus gelatinilytica]